MTFPLKSNQLSPKSTVSTLKTTHPSSELRADIKESIRKWEEAVQGQIFSPSKVSGRSVTQLNNFRSLSANSSPRSPIARAPVKENNLSRKEKPPSPVVSPPRVRRKSLRESLILLSPRNREKELSSDSGGLGRNVSPIPKRRWVKRSSSNKLLSDYSPMRPSLRIIPDYLFEPCDLEGALRLLGDSKGGNFKEFHCCGNEISHSLGKLQFLTEYFKIVLPALKIEKDAADLAIEYTANNKVVPSGANGYSEDVEYQLLAALSINNFFHAHNFLVNTFPDFFNSASWGDELAFKAEQAKGTLNGPIGEYSIQIKGRSIIAIQRRPYELKIIGEDKLWHRIGSFNIEMHTTCITSGNQPLNGWQAVVYLYQPIFSLGVDKHIVEKMLCIFENRFNSN